MLGSVWRITGPPTAYHFPYGSIFTESYPLIKSSLVLIALVLSVCGVCVAEIFTVGAGSYTDDLAEFDPEDHGPTYTPRIIEEAPYPYPTSDWWTSVLTEDYSHNLFAIPLAFRCDDQGLLVDRPGLLFTKDAVYSPFEPDLRIGLLDVKHDAALAAGWGDFTVDIRFPGEQAEWTATIGHGLPFVYARFDQGTPEITFLSGVKVIQRTADSLLIRADDGVLYGVYFVGGDTETHDTEGHITLRLPGCTYLSVATLPDESWFERYRPAAFQRITGSLIDHVYDEQAGEVTTTYRVQTESMKGESVPTYLALFPHHYKGQGLELTEAGYDSIRGRLKVVHANEFRTVLPFHGLMPFFPEPESDTYDAAHLSVLLENIAAQEKIFVDTKDELVLALMEQGSDMIPAHGETYFTGKQLAHIARLIPIADLSGNQTVKNRLITALREELMDWFTATPGEKERYFYYDRTCGGLIGMNSSFWTFNYGDQHFHYAHFVYASAILSLYDPGFKENYGEMVELLIHAYNSPDHANPMFPRMRMMDPYEGHSWANGLGGWGEGLEDDGNDQESSSESMHGWQAIFFWGMVTGNDRLRDYGVWGYVTEASAIDQYYFDVDDDIYPNGTEFNHDFVSILMGGKASHVGYFDFTEYTFGIQYLPITPSSLYLGYNPDHSRRQYNNFVQENDGEEDRWFDNFWMYQALFDPESVLTKYDESVKIDNDGNSFANVYRWVHFMAVVGHVDVSVAAAWPYTSAFRKGDQITVLAYNPGDEPVEVPFRLRVSGEPLITLTVAPGSIATGTVEAR